MTTTFGFLRNVPLFAGLPEADLEQLCGLVKEVSVEPGQWLFGEGEAGDRAYVIQSGALEILKRSSGRDVLLAVRGAGEVIGEMSLLEEAPRVAGARARERTRVLAIDRKTLEHLVQASPSAALQLYHTVVARLQSTVGLLRQSEKMAQIGTLTAGVAHELNNPSAAVQRGAAELPGAIEALQRATASALKAGVDPAALVRPPLEPPSSSSALARADLEAQVEAHLAARGVEKPWELAAALVDDGWSPDALSAFAGGLKGAALAGALGWVGARARVDALAFEIHEGAKRLSGIVSALKSYSHLDRAPEQAVDVNKGIEDTLVILRGKLKGVQVKTELAPGLPAITGFGGELNQVWTNLIDNAADALGEKGGTITVRSFMKGPWVRVEVQDDGPGVPPHLKERIFDAFFTTKPPGKGTGLGLDISWRIVVDHHGGDLKVESVPGRTVFSVELPAGAGERPAVGAEAQGAQDQALRRLLEETRTIAVVGASKRPDRPAHTVPAYLQEHGYRLRPVARQAEELFGEKVVEALPLVERPVDLVLVFRPKEELLELVDQASAVGAKAVWAQEGIHDDSAVARAHALGLTIVTDRCIRTTHRRLFGAREKAAGGKP